MATVQATSWTLGLDSSTPSRRPAVWLLDDSPTQIELARRTLAPIYDVTTFEQGASLLEALSSASSPDLLILDWHVPDVAGVDVCRFARLTKNLAELPILILTASDDNDHLLEAMEAGANDFVRKPFVETELKARVAALTGLALLHSRLTRVEHRLRVEGEFRERFMGMLAHDLRQPLNAIYMSAKAIAEYGTDARTAGFLDIQARATGRMTRMVEELLDFTRIRPETGMPIRRRTVDLAEILQATLDELRAGHPEHPLQLTVDGSCAGEWDPDRLAQVCDNLIGNACEHGAPGTVVDVSLSGVGSAVELGVTSRGATIPEELLATFFEPFRRGPQDKKPSKGLGLGLHIVEQIVRAHGGSIAVSSADGDTRFLVTLPRGA